MSAAFELEPDFLPEKVDQEETDKKPRSRKISAKVLSELRQTVKITHTIILNSKPDLASYDPTTDGHWRDSALCQALEPELFYSDMNEEKVLAKLYCGKCAVKDYCLTEALELGDKFGIWGGLEVDERNRLGTRHRSNTL